MHSSLQTVTGEKAPIHGKVVLELRIRDLTILHPMWIADIKDECILGLDFLQRHHCLVNLKQSSLRVGAQEFPLRKASLKSERTCCRAVLTDRVSIPPFSEAIIPVRIDPAQGSMEWGLLETSDEADHQVDGVLVGRTLVDVHKEAIHLRVVNLSHEPKTIRRGTTVAKCKPINCVSISEAVPSTDEAPGTVRRASINEIPHHLEPLLLQSTEGLSVEKKETVCQLLCEFSNLFSTGPRDLGCTGLAKH